MKEMLKISPEIKEKLNNFSKDIQKSIQPALDMFSVNHDLTESLHEIRKQEAEKYAQPFETNYLLKKLIKYQTPKWVNYLMLISTLLILIFTIILLYRT